MLKNQDYSFDLITTTVYYVTVNVTRQRAAQFNTVAGRMTNHNSIGIFIHRQRVPRVARSRTHFYTRTITNIHSGLYFIS